MKPISHKTWCDDSILAAIILEDILNKDGDAKLIKKINILFHKFSIRMNSLSSLEKGERKYYMHLHLKETKNLINFTYNDPIKSYLLNVIHAIWNNKMKLI